MSHGQKGLNIVGELNSDGKVLSFCDMVLKWSLCCRYCWPYFDKKQEQEFRKTCTNWVTKIAKVLYITH